jgi:hypothetical protein
MVLNRRRQTLSLDDGCHNRRQVEIPVRDVKHQQPGGAELSKIQAHRFRGHQVNRNGV